jgi:3-methyl-2-oxobutanoate hydroxymethyltransferase
LGCTSGHKPRHAKSYRNFQAEYDRLQQERIAAFRDFRQDVETGAYPDQAHSIGISDAELAAFVAALDKTAS